ncbi:hypothetical protein Tco_0144491 [Tanacetum coccineum]
MGRGTWYYSLGVFLEIVDVFVRSEFEISSWRGARVGVRTYLLGGAIDSSEANGIIRDPKLELESSRFTFDLVPLSYESVDVVVGENWLLRHKAEMPAREDSSPLALLSNPSISAIHFPIIGGAIVSRWIKCGHSRIAKLSFLDVTACACFVRESSVNTHSSCASSHPTWHSSSGLDQSELLMM